ncbi:hypothetical protein MuYL_3554 [Mucilaginibacter xinganensis]|uniref:Uncharacterized protein n=1 Tax=Mucilaginibacter xinganensis TaxID=1234841 RepID=A0A223NZX4_9SPHI|nr:hypothetical protein MuYL_3554 [Mucilaginibacter xinganensis]
MLFKEAWKQVKQMITPLMSYSLTCHFATESGGQYPRNVNHARYLLKVV